MNATQTSLFDLSLARQARDAAIERVRINADASWSDRALAAVYRTASRLERFASDERLARGAREAARAAGDGRGDGRCCEGWLLPPHGQLPTHEQRHATQPADPHLRIVGVSVIAWCLPCQRLEETTIGLRRRPACQPAPAGVRTAAGQPHVDQQDAGIDNATHIGRYETVNPITLMTHDEALAAFHAAEARLLGRNE